MRWKFALLGFRVLSTGSDCRLNCAISTPINLEDLEIRGDLNAN